MNRSYFRSGLFIQYGLTLNGTQSKRDQYSVGEQGITYLQSRLDQAVPILFGVGRIEPIQDARLAVYILQDLQASGRMKRIPDQNEILEIARVISSVKSQRFFDSREKLIWEIGMVDSCLQSKGIIASSDATYFTRLYDNWLYAAGPVRESGKRFTTGLISHLFSNGNNSYKMNSPDATSYWGSVWVEAVARMESAHPVSLTWQTGSLFELSGQLIQGFSSDSTLNWHQDPMAVLSGKVNYAIGWYPNSRTNVDLSLNLNSQLYRGVPIVKTDRSLYFELFPEIELTAYYYIAPQLRLNLSYNAVYNLNGNRWDDLYSGSILHSFDKGFNQSFSLNFTYSLF